MAGWIEFPGESRRDGPTIMTRPDGWEGIEGIVLDAVGTLIDPEPPVARAYALAALRQGLVVDEVEVKRRFARYFRDDEADEQLGPLVTDEATEYRRWRRIVANVLPDLPDQARAFEELWDHFGRPDAWRCFVDVGPGLARLRQAGIPVRVASNFDGRLRGVAAGLPELAGFVDSLVISSEVGHRKPHPAFYAAACASLRLPPSRVLCVGDDPENDVLGAERAGLRGALLDRDSRRPKDLASFPDLVALADWFVAARSRLAT
jgi:putative hydrolase of the HAD superfamily